MSTMRLEALRVRNFRVLRDVKLEALTPMTVLVGPNGSGKTTFLDVLAFLSECFSIGLRKAWSARGRARELRSRNAEGPIEFELTCRRQEAEESVLFIYHIAIDEEGGQPIVRREFLGRRLPSGSVEPWIEFQEGRGKCVKGTQAVEKTLASPDALAVDVLGQFAGEERLGALRKFIADWMVASLSPEAMRATSEVWMGDRLSKTGGNLAAVIKNLQEHHPSHWERIETALKRRFPWPGIDWVKPHLIGGEHLVLEIKEQAFTEPTPVRRISDGVLQALGHLVLLETPTLPRLMGIEHPERHIFCQELVEMGRRFRTASERCQIFVTTHTLSFLEPLGAEQVQVFYRGKDGYACVKRVSEIQAAQNAAGAGETLRGLWMDGHCQWKI